MRRRSEWQGSLLILLSAACFGAGSIFGKAAYAAGADVLTFLFLRFLIASVLLWLGIAVTGHRWPALSPRALAACVALGAVGYAPQSLIFFTALRYISASLAALILYTYPPIVTLLAMVILGEGLDRWKVMALGTAAVGLLLTLSRGLGAATGLGVGLVLLSAASFSVYIVVSRMVLRAVPSLAASAVIIPSACAAFGLYGGLAGQLRFGLSSGAYLAIGGMASVSTVLAIVMFFAGLERVGPPGRPSSARSSLSSRSPWAQRCWESASHSARSRAARASWARCSCCTGRRWRRSRAGSLSGRKPQERFAVRENPLASKRVPGGLMKDDLRLVRDGPIATIVLNRPEKRNAITIEMWQALPGILAGLESDQAVRVVIVRGAGDEAFASGADISEFERVRGDARTARTYSATVGSAEHGLADFPRPTIAMIHGFCVGGGLELALACDVRWASRASRFGITAARLGIVYSLAATRRLAGVVGPSHARDLLFSGRLVDAESARAMGLVNHLCAPDALEEETYAYARLLAQQAPLSQRGAKMMLQHLLGEGDMAASDLSAIIERAYGSEDYREGVRAFLEKRPPRFHGR